jgi:hypothetical protein
MKCIQLCNREKLVVRVKNDVAEQMVKECKARYVPKSVWKEQGRRYHAMSQSEKRRIKYMENKK